jgi:hypothetical protein
MGCYRYFNSNGESGNALLMFMWNMTLSRRNLVKWLQLSVCCTVARGSLVTANEKANADVLAVEAFDKGGDGGWTFKVTVAHPDTGWQDYCDGWDVVTDQGEVLKRNPADPFTRLLLHPHESEQPFTRSQGGIIIPEGVKQLTVRAHDLVDGFGGLEITLDLTTASGPGYVIIK